MHELSIATGIIDAVVAEADARGFAAVSAVHVRLGAWAGVDPEALAFSFRIATQGTMLEGAELVVNDVAASFICDGCGREHRPGNEAPVCPQCGAPTHLLHGRELELTSFEAIEQVLA